MKTKDLVVYSIYLLLMVAVLYIIMTTDVPNAIIYTSEYFYIAYKVVMIVNIDIALGVGYYTFSKKIRTHDH